MHHHHIIDEQDDLILYKPTAAFRKAWVLFKMIGRRLADLLQAYRYDFVIIQREAFMLGTTFFEQNIRRFSTAKIIFDFDDAIWLPNVSEGNRRWAFLKNTAKTSQLIALSDAVVAGNHYLLDYAKRYNTNTRLIPSAIDLRQYDLAQYPPRNNVNNPITIGWMGSSTTIPYFQTLLPALRLLYQKYGERIRLRVVGDASFQPTELPIESLAWTPATEVSLIHSFDIGVMPMPQDEWAKGKCAMKGLQYMAMAVPSVMQRFGANVTVVQEGHNGLLANSTDEWVEQLSMLIEHAELRQQIGAEGRKTVERHYSVQVLQQDWIALFEQLSNPSN